FNRQSPNARVFAAMSITRSSPNESIDTVAPYRFNLSRSPPIPIRCTVVITSASPPCSTPHITARESPQFAVTITISPVSSYIPLPSSSYIITTVAVDPCRSFHSSSSCILTSILKNPIVIRSSTLSSSSSSLLTTFPLLSYLSIIRSSAFGTYVSHLSPIFRYSSTASTPLLTVASSISMCNSFTSFSAHFEPPCLFLYFSLFSILLFYSIFQYVNL
ncbi:hypothetical protein AX774_g1029, partial [Zancudomyces culisetae]